MAITLDGTDGINTPQINGGNIVGADPLFFKWQRGTATEQEWLDKIAEIKVRYPDPEVSA